MDVKSSSLAIHTDSIDVEIHTIGQHNAHESTTPTNKYLLQRNELINCPTSYMYNIYVFRDAYTYIRNIKHSTDTLINY